MIKLSKIKISIIKIMRMRNLLLIVLGLLLITVRVVGAQSSANYVMQRFVIVGGGSADSANYAVTSVFGQATTDVVASPNYKVSGGFLFPRRQGSFTVGGTLSGLAGGGLVLQNNGGDNLPVGANGVFTFATELADSSTYLVTVETQPTNPAQTCTVTNGAGAIAGSDVTNVAITCATTIVLPKILLPLIQH